jgi:predicted peptidase
VGSVGAGIAVAGGAAFGASAAAQENTRSDGGSGRVRGVTAITEVYGDGQKFVAVALEYDRAISDRHLSTSAFTVSGRTVTDVYANRAAERADRGEDGRFVIVELSPDDAGAALWSTGGGGGGGGGAGAGAGAGASAGSTGSPTASPSATASSPSAGASSPSAGATASAAATAQSGPAILTPSATVTQSGTVYTTSGRRYEPDGTALTTDQVVNPVVDDFRQLTFDDPETGKSLPYNLFVPRDYNPRKKYPLVLFMHDASVVGAPVRGPLVQGLGAVVWASPEDQAKRECFVLAPQYPSVVVEDDYLPTDLFDTTIHLVEHLTDRYSIDAGRRYATGQSMGAMMSLGFGIKYTDVFAALFVVAGQWPAEQAAPLAGKKLWVHVSEGDTKAFPGENAIMKVIKAEGTRVATAAGWDAGFTQAEYAAAVRAIEAQKAPVQYTTFLAGTVTGTGGDAGSEHMGTWKYAYGIPGIRDWVFRQSL